VNKSLSKHLPSTRLLVPLYKEALEKEAEELRRVSEKAKRPLKEWTDEELMEFLWEERQKEELMEKKAAIQQNPISVKSRKDQNVLKSIPKHN
jgi:hypothetical protein